jgi:CheY-like chemotaxis protein
VISGLQVLYFEDDPRAAELIQATFAAENVACALRRVDTQAEFLALLQRGGLDLILADYTLHSFQGISALKLAKEIRPEVPFIFVSATLGEETAIEALQLGATDYVLKTRLSRLVSSAQRALREAKEKIERKRAEGSVQLQLGLLQDMPAAAWTLLADGTPDFANRQWLEYSGQTLDYLRSSPESWMSGQFAATQNRCLMWNTWVTISIPAPRIPRLQCATL